MESDNYELYDYARKRIKQKKQLYFHFVLFFVGSIFMFVINYWMEVGAPYEWFVWAITIWFFIFILHFIKVFITDSFMNKNWEKVQIDRLIALQKKKLQQLEAKTDENLKNTTQA